MARISGISGEPGGGDAGGVNEVNGEVCVSGRCIYNNFTIFVEVLGGINYFSL